jgi:hypothetical protein
MLEQTESPAVAIALAHVEAWSSHDFETARNGLASDVNVTAASTNPMLPDTNLDGVDVGGTGPGLPSRSLLLDEH